MSMQIDLRKVKTVCISMQKSVNRRESIVRLMNRLGFQRWSFFDGIEDSDPVVGCAKSHIAALKEHDFSEPLLLLEDDVDTTPHYEDILSIPRDTDALYLGYSWWAWSRDRATMSKLDTETCLQREGEYYRISNMTSAHAVLYMSEAYADAVVSEIDSYLLDQSGNKHCDVAMAKVQKNYKVLATPKHYFFQVCPRNTYWTNRSILT